MWLIKQILCLAIQSVVLRPVAIASPGNLLEMLTLRLQCRPAESESEFFFAKSFPGVTSHNHGMMLGAHLQT